MAGIAPGIDRRQTGLRIRIYWKGQTFTTLDEGPGDAAHVRRCIKRRDWLVSRLKAGLPIFEDDQARLAKVAEAHFSALDLEATTLRAYRSLWRNHWAPHLADMTANQVTTPKVRELLADMALARASKRMALAVLSGILDHGEANPNPCRPIRIKSQQRPKMNRYQPDEWAALLEHLDGAARLYFVLFRACGLRPAEILALRWEDYDGEQLSVTKQVCQRKLKPQTKTARARMVHVPTWARPYLDRHPSRFAGEWLLPNADGSYTSGPEAFNREWQKAHRRARVPYREPYMLRHTRAAEMLSCGILPARAASQLGHSTAMFLNTYSEFLDAYADADMGSLDGEIVPKPPGTQKKVMKSSPRS